MSTYYNIIIYDDLIRNFISYREKYLYQQFIKVKAALPELSQALQTRGAGVLETIGREVSLINVARHALTLC